MVKMGTGSDRPEVVALRGKVVGRRKLPAASLENMTRFNRTVAFLRGTVAIVPRGVYRFRTFEEADQWMSKRMARTHALRTRATLSASVKR